MAVIAIAFTHVLWAQNIFTGTISDTQTGEPVSFAKIKNQKSGAIGIVDASGSFKIENTSAGDQLIIRAYGYVEQVISASENVNIQLVSDAIDFNEVIVSNNREIQQRKDAPISISVVRAQQIADNKPTTIDQVLNQNAGVLMVDLGNEQHTMSIRRPIDFGASYLYLEDGVPIRTSGVFNHNALLEINMPNVSRIEIIRGPSSSLFGSESIGGAINFITQKPSLKPTAGVSIQANNIGYRRIDVNASNTLKKLGIRFSGYYAANQNGVREHSDFNKIAASLNFKYKINSKIFLTLDNTIVNYGADMSGSLDSAKFFEQNYGSNQTFTRRDVFSLRSKLGVKKFWNKKGTVTSAFAYFRNNSVKQLPSYRIKDDFKPWIPAGDPNLAHGEENDNRFNSYGAIIQHKSSFEWLKSSIIVGVSADFSPNQYDANYIQVHKNDAGVYESYISRKDSMLASYQANLLNTAGYLQGSISPMKNLTILGGVRYDQFIYDFDNHLDSNAFTGVLDGRNTFQRLTPKIGATYTIQEFSGLYLNYGQGFVPPQVTELYRGEKVPRLLPVYYHNYEFGGWISLFNKRLRIEANVFRMDGENEIISVLLDDGSTERQNAGRTTHQGIEYTLTAQPIKSIVFRFSGTNANHRFIDYIVNGTDLGGNQMPQAPKWIANSQITWKPTFFKGFRLSAEWQHVSEYFMETANEKIYDGYDIFNLRTGYQWKGLEVWVNAINVGNTLFSTVARSSKWGQSYSLGTPRSFTLGLAYQFKGK